LHESGARSQQSYPITESDLLEGERRVSQRYHTSAQELTTDAKDSLYFVSSLFCNSSYSGHIDGGLLKKKEAHRCVPDVS
jgi:hypothetical protein